MKDTARAAAQLGVEVVTGFTGSSIWHLLYSFPPNDFAVVDAGYEDFAERWGPIVDVFEAEGVKFALEVHPTEIAYDFVTTRTGARRDRRPRRLRHQLRPEPLRAPVPRLGRLHHRVRAEDLPRAHQGLRAPARRAHVDPRRPPRLRPARPRLGLRLARPRRRRLRVDDPGAQPGRLRRPAVDRVGGLRHGSRLGRARRARVRAPHRLRALVGRLRRRVREGALMSEVGFVTMGKASGGGDVKPIGVGMLGYAFMGKAHSNAYKTLAYMTWPPPLMPQLVAIAGRNEEAVSEAAQRYGFAGHVTDWKALIADERVRAVRQRGPEQPARGADDRGRGGRQARDLREAAGPRRGGVLRDVAARRGDGRQAHVRVQLPLRARDPARAPDHRVGRARRDPALPRRVPAGVGHDRGRHLALPEGRRRLRRARRPRRARDRPRPLPGRRDRRGLRAHRHVPAGPRRRRRRRGRGRVPERRRRDDRGRRASARGARTTSRGRSTDPRARCASTWSGSTSSQYSDGQRRLPRRCSCPRPTTRSGSTGGRRGT